MTKQEVYKKIKLWAPPLIWATIIYKLSDGRVPVASSVYWQDFAFKKSAHIFFYGVLAILLYRGMIGEGINKKMAAIWALVLAIFYGVTDEYHQSFTQGREARIRDIGFDGIGATLGSTLVYNILPMMPKEVLKLAKEFQIL